MKRLLTAAMALCIALVADAQGTTGATRMEEQVMTVQKDGSYVVNTTTLSKEVKGYKGTTPLKITVKDDIITAITPLRNRETAEYFQQAQAALQQWVGKGVSEAQALQVDGVTGATLSFDALKENVRLGLEFYQKNK